MQNPRKIEYDAYIFGHVASYRRFSLVIRDSFVVSHVVFIEIICKIAKHHDKQFILQVQGKSKLQGYIVAKRYLFMKGYVKSRQLVFKFNLN